MSLIKITLRKSTIGTSWRQRRVVESLGLRKLNHSVIQEDSPSILGMTKKVSHLVHVELA